MKRAAAWLLAVVAVLTSCKDGTGSLLPKGSGRPYEVLVTSANAEAASIIDSVLSAPAEALPQSEPCFDVSNADSSRFSSTMRMARSIVIVTVDADRFTSTRIRYEKNVWAKPQIVVYINTPSATSLRLAMNKAGGKLTDLLTRSEMNTAIALLEKGSNTAAEKDINRMFGAEMKIPADMKSSKRGKDFIWLSNNTSGGMRNICVYSYPGTRLDAERFTEARDSIMRLNIPGETQGMFMTTTAGSVLARLSKEHGGVRMVCRGLWEMHGDAMGGPFVAHAAVDSAAGRIIVAEAFVYAPEMKKRNLIRSAEAALYTMKPAGKGQKDRDE